MNNKKLGLVALIGLILAIAGSICCGCGLLLIGAMVGVIGTVIETALVAYELSKADVGQGWIFSITAMLVTACGLFIFAAVIASFR